MPIANVPSNVLVQPGNGQIYLSWTPAVGASTGQLAPSTGNYDIMRSSDGVNYSVLASPISSFTYDTPSSGIVYYYGVRSNNLSGQSNMSLPVPSTVVGFGKVSLGQIRLAAQQRADMINNQFVTTQEWNDYINHSYTELYDILIQVYADDYYVSTPYQFTTDGRNPALYDLPSNLYKLLGVDLGINPSNNAWLTLNKFPFRNRNRYVYANVPLSYLGINQLQYRLLGSQIEFVPASQGNQQVRLWFIPRPITLLADSDVLDGISGWDEYVIVDAAIKALQKEESDCSLLMAQKQALMVRITAAGANRDAGQGEVATDMRRLDGSSNFDPFGDGPMAGY